MPVDNAIWVTGASSIGLGKVYRPSITGTPAITPASAWTPDNSLIFLQLEALLFALCWVLFCLLGACLRYLF